MFLICLATLLLLCSPIVSFLKDKDDIIENKKGKDAWKYPVAFFVIGLLGVSLSLYNSVTSLKAKNVADSTAQATQVRYDSLFKREINFLGAGSARPLFFFGALSSNLFQFLITDTADHPMRDIRVTVQDDLAYDAFKAKFTSAETDSGIIRRDLMIFMRQGYSTYGRDFRVPFLTSQDYQELFTENVGTSTHLKYTVVISWSNGDLAYYIECFKGNSGWREKRTCYDRINEVSVSE